ncbi:hypothetical protein [Nocardioides sp. KR10-350]
MMRRTKTMVAAVAVAVAATLAIGTVSPAGAVVVRESTSHSWCC